MTDTDIDIPHTEERLALTQRMNSLLGHMTSTPIDELDVEEEQSDGVKLHHAKAILLGYMRRIQSDVVQDDQNKTIIVPFKDICQICYLFYFGLYPSLYVLNGSGEDGDEYHCNGVLVINITDGRFNYLNIYNASNPQQIVTLEEDWDKEHCGTCVVESIQLPKTLLNTINNDKLFQANIKYNCIFRCGGIAVSTFAQCYDFSVIIYKNVSKLLTTVDDRITQQLTEFALGDVNTELIVDSLNAFEVQLPKITLQLPKIAYETDYTKCNCIWNKKYGLIAMFKHIDCIYQFDWFDTFEWKILSGKMKYISCDPIPSLCSITDENNDEYLFAFGDNSLPNDNKSTNTELYSFKDKEWRVLTSANEDQDAVRQGICSMCYDSKRNRVYQMNRSQMVDCYDFNENEWIYDSSLSFPHPLPEATYAIFLDKLSGDQLWCAGTESVLMCVDLIQPDKWEISEEMQFYKILTESPNHSDYTFERLICST